MKILRIFDKTFGFLQPVLIPVNQIKYVRRGTNDEIPDWCNPTDVYNTVTVVLLDGENICGLIPADEQITIILEADNETK